MTKIKYLLTIFFLILSVAAFSQSMDGMFGGTLPGNAKAPTNSPKEYTDAVLRAEKALENLRSGDFKEADRLIQESISTYPTLKIFDYCKALARLSDIAGANLIAEKAVNKVKQLATDVYIVHEGPFSLNIPSLISNQRTLFIFLEETFTMNKEYGEITRIIKSLDALTAVDLPPHKVNGYDQGQLSKFSYGIYKATYSGEYQKAINLIESKPISKTWSKAIRDNELLVVYDAAEDYPKLIEQAKKIETGGWLFKAYASLGNVEMATQQYEKEAKIREGQQLIFGFPKDDNYYLALVSIAKKEYRLAISQLDQSLIIRAKEIEKGMRVVEKWKYNKAYGDAYAGLLKYDKAKDNYNIALLINPKYQPAIDGLAKLNVVYATDIATDKTPPVISLLEPSPKRGLKISSTSAKVMVKGIATDPSGIKEVFINGQKVYSQTGGDFWSDVALLDGLNKISIAATDMAGNKAEQVFEIEKVQPIENAVPTDIIAVTEKEGKNYCLLIASQNYVDTSIPSLENPIADAVKLKIVLKQNYNFVDNNIISLFNPSGNDIKRQLLELTNTIQPEDNLLIFYAGHGIWVEKEKKGYWLMTDAVYKDMSTWTPNKDILDLIAKLPARHTLLITDACFSGSVFKTRGIPGNAPTAIKELDSKISRIAITSGNDTEVPDESVFMKYLVKALSENKEKYFTAQKMFITQILEAVMTETKTEPRYGTLELAGHVGGDYIFSKK